MQRFKKHTFNSYGTLLRFFLSLLVLSLLVGCSTQSPQQPTLEKSADTSFHVPRRTDIPLTPEQERVRQQATRAVEADIDGYLARYIEELTVKHDSDGNVIVKGTGDMVSAMRRGPLVISADDMRDLFPAYAASKGSRSIHSQSVHEAVSAMAAELYRRALEVDDPRGNNTVLFTAGGVASGKTTAIRTIDAVKREAMAAQIIYDGTMRSHEKSLRRINMALDAGKLVGIVYVFAPIEKSAVWLVSRAVKSGRVVQADAAGRSHWQAQHTFLKLIEEFEGNDAVSFRLIDKSTDESKLVPPEFMQSKLYSNDPRFPDMEAFIVYTKKLIRIELDKAKADGKLIPETEEAFKAGA
jgi:hypothetical protein